MSVLVSVIVSVVVFVRECLCLCALVFVCGLFCCLRIVYVYCSAMYCYVCYAGLSYFSARVAFVVFQVSVYCMFL